MKFVFCPVLTKKLYGHLRYTGKPKLLFYFYYVMINFD